TACLQAKTWRAEGLPVRRIAVNVSGREFALADYPAQVATILRETGIDPALLELDISESVVMADEASAVRTLHQLNVLGDPLALATLQGAHRLRRPRPVRGEFSLQSPRRHARCATAGKLCGPRSPILSGTPLRGARRRRFCAPACTAVSASRPVPPTNCSAMSSTARAGAST